MSRLTRFLVPLPLGIAAIAGVAYYGGVFNGEGETSLRRSEMTVEDLYRAVDEKLAQQDGSLHIRSESEVESYYSLKGTGDRWFSADERRVREHAEFNVEFEGEKNTVSSTTLTTPDEYSTFQHDPFPDGRNSSVASSGWRLCYASSPAASSLLGCKQATSDTERWVEEGKLRGQQVIVLVDSGTSEDSESNTWTTTRLYLDAETLMPVESRTEGHYTADPSVTIAGFATFDEPEILTAADLDANFFEPSGIGYVAPDPQAALRAVTDLQAYWLGSELVLPDGEILVLTGSMEAPAPGRPYRLSLQYATKAKPHEPPIVTVMVFHREMWERSPAIWSQARTFGDVVVFVNEGTINGRGLLLSKPGVLDFVLDSLRPYEG